MLGIQTAIARDISKATGEPFEIQDSHSVGGGSINQSYAISNGRRTYFLKLNQASQSEMFVAEAIGLKQMYETQTIRVPEPICWGVEGNHTYMVMECLEFGRGSSGSWEKMGQQLAAMHRVGKSDRFGWGRNNTIGSTPQINTWTDNWADFFAEYRIGYQLRLAKRKGGNFPKVEPVIETVRERLQERQPQASLVHGDLWGGNAAITTDGEPVILDPATYYGDREVDIAMTELFGGFPAAFYRGYNQAWELDSGYRDRKDLYNLYHILNHFNLFGGGYGGQARSIIERLLR